MQPNIVVLLLDAARADHVSCYGYDRTTTPFVDELADDGVRYDPAFANSIFSLPSYASLFTGEYPTHHGAVDWNRRVDGNPLVAGLNDRGYETAAVSTHLLSGQFGLAEEFDGLETVAFGPDDRLFEDDPVGDAMAEYANREGFDSEREKYAYFLRTLARRPSLRSVGNGAFAFYRKLRKRYGFWNDDGGADVVDRCERVVDDADEPFFLFANFVETHDPYRPPRSFVTRFLPEDATLSELRSTLDYSSVGATLGRDEITDRQRDILVALYDAEIAYVDELVRRFHECLRENGYADDTVVVVLSDHGDFFGEHGLWGHQGRVYDPVCRVPLVVRYPWETDEPAVGPRELRQLPEHLHALADGNRTTMPPCEQAFVEYYGWDTQLSFVPWEDRPDAVPESWRGYQCATIDDEYKLVWDATGRIELFPADDRSELDDVSADNPEAVDERKARIERTLGTPAENHERYRSEEARTEGFDFDEDSDDVRNRLRELGYME